MDGKDHEADGEVIGFPAAPGYMLVRRLALGGSSEVFLAQAQADREVPVALKILRPKGAPANLLERFQRECAILRRLDHPHIARLLDSGRTLAGDPFIVTEYVDGRTLRAWIEEERPSLKQKLAIFLQAAEAVDHSHQHQVVHRDLTMENLLVDASGHARLVDFGVALPDQPEALATNILPDVYALGLILRELVAGEERKDLQAIAYRAADRRPHTRHPTVRELIMEVEAYQAGLPVRSYSSGLGYRFGKFIARNKLAVGLLFAVAASAVVALLVTGDATLALG